MKETVIRVENLSKSYRIGKALSGENNKQSFFRRFLSPFRYLSSTLHEPTQDEIIWALKDVSFNVNLGEVVGIIGRNGAGKSTLLKILSRITEPSSGMAQLYGRVGSLLEVGTGFHPELTGRENIYLSGAILGMKSTEIERRFDEIVDFSGVEKFIDTPIKRYSSGMNVRLGFAVAAHLDPEILLVDEVLAVGDAAFQKKCLGKLGEVAKGGRTVLFVSHNMPTVASLCERVIVVNDGRVGYDGFVNEGIERYLQTVSASVKNKGDGFQDWSSGSDYVRDFQVTNKAGLFQTQFKIGEPIQFQITINATDKLLSPHMGIGINSSLGNRVTTLLSTHQGQLPTMIMGKVLVACTVTDLLLMPGSYGIKLALGAGAEEIFTVELADVFEVIPGDYWGTGRLPNASQGMILANATWEAIG